MFAVEFALGHIAE